MLFLHFPQPLCLRNNQSRISKNLSLFHPQFLESFHFGDTSLIFCHVIDCLEVQLNYRRYVRSFKSTPFPFPYWFTAPSKYIFHAPSSMSKISSSRKSSLPSSPSTGFLAQKSDNTPFDGFPCHILQIKFR